jgi:hypothetical protein
MEVDKKSSNLLELLFVWMHPLVAVFINNMVLAVS